MVKLQRYSYLKETKMFKFSTLLALLALFCVVNAQGQIVPVAEVPGNVQDLAK